jgi:hypothetical protein
MKHGGEGAATTHGNGALSHELEWWAHLPAEQSASFVFSTRKGNLEGMKEAVEAGAGVETDIGKYGASYIISMGRRKKYTGLLWH